MLRVKQGRWGGGGPAAGPSCIHCLGSQSASLASALDLRIVMTQGGQDEGTASFRCLTDMRPTTPFLQPTHTLPSSAARPGWGGFSLRHHMQARAGQRGVGPLLREPTTCLKSKSSCSPSVCEMQSGPLCMEGTQGSTLTCSLGQGDKRHGWDSGTG